MMRFGLLLCSALTLTGCATSFKGANLDHGAAAYGIIPASAPGGHVDDYHIGALDQLDVTVFQEPDLSVKGTEVNTAGRITLPLIGNVMAAGKTGPELATEVAALYGARYLEHPQVSVAVTESVSQKVVVQGEVTEPGVYEIKGHATLLEVISMAKGETKVAATRQVAVFRNISGQRTGALFDVAAIRRGEAADPELLGSDVVTVGLSNAKSTWRDILATAPMLAVFRPLGM